MMETMSTLTPTKSNSREQQSSSKKHAIQLQSALSKVGTWVLPICVPKCESQSCLHKLYQHASRKTTEEISHLLYEH